MIPVKKRTRIPETLSSQAVVEALGEHRATIQRDGKVKSDLFKKGIWTSDRVRRALWEDQHRKCCYCEKLLELKRESDVEHFRPKAGVTDVDEHPGYWWLAYSWGNLLYSCKHCNSEYKKNYFPVAEEERRAFNEADDIGLERPLLINPSLDNPDNYLIYYCRSGRVWMQGSPLDNRDKGKTTIKYCGLNRDELTRRRFEKLQTVRKAIEALQTGINSGNEIIINDSKKEALRLTDPASSFSGLARYFFEQAGLVDYITR